MLISFSFGVLNVFSYSVGTLGPRKNSGSHIDASLSRQPLVKGERLVRYEVNAVMRCVIQLLIFTLIACLSWWSPHVWEAGRVIRIVSARQNRNVAKHHSRSWLVHKIEGRKEILIPSLPFGYDQM